MLVLTRKIGTSVTIGDPRSTEPPVEIMLLDIDYYQDAATFSVAGTESTVLYPPEEHKYAEKA